MSMVNQLPLLWFARWKHIIKNKPEKKCAIHVIFIWIGIEYRIYFSGMRCALTTILQHNFIANKRLIFQLIDEYLQSKDFRTLFMCSNHICTLQFREFLHSSFLHAGWFICSLEIHICQCWDHISLQLLNNCNTFHIHIMFFTNFKWNIGIDSLNGNICSRTINFAQKNTNKSIFILVLLSQQSIKFEFVLFLFASNFICKIFARKHWHTYVFKKNAL